MPTAKDIIMKDCKTILLTLERDTILDIDAMLRLRGEGKGRTAFFRRAIATQLFMEELALVGLDMSTPIGKAIYLLQAEVSRRFGRGAEEGERATLTREVAERQRERERSRKDRKEADTRATANAANADA